MRVTLLWFPQAEYLLSVVGINRVNGRLEIRLGTRQVLKVVPLPQTWWSGGSVVVYGVPFARFDSQVSQFVVLRVPGDRLAFQRTFINPTLDWFRGAGKGACWNGWVFNIKNLEICGFRVARIIL